jgi:hypothetical protein
MLTDIAVPPRLEPLLRLGDDDSLRQKLDGWHDYVAEFGLTPADVPALVAMLQRWVDVIEEEEPDEDDEPRPEWCAPIHAWRALGQLRTVEAVEPMLAQNDRLDVAIDDWSMEDWPDVFGMIGPPALPALLAYAADGAHREFARDLAVRGAVKIAEQFPDVRDRVVEALTAQLARHDAAPIVNAGIAGKLADLRAVESAEVIERAFAADVVDESMYGCWGDLRKELGVEGLGLAPLTRRSRWNDNPEVRFDRPHNPGRQDRERKAAKREKAKRKAAAKARKHNRRTK